MDADLSRAACGSRGRPRARLHTYLEATPGRVLWAVIAVGPIDEVSDTACAEQIMTAQVDGKMLSGCLCVYERIRLTVADHPDPAANEVIDDADFLAERSSTS
ncbi:hypothetical protein [Halorubrum lacusprofundi]|uniref:hypothetical protein n=1 Tax=Halorubrum lacusprofundi TaxID=2247 RepID=UPI00145E1614|nr:hypothetical protein [Halorubrum lacusprofundi]